MVEGNLTGQRYRDEIIGPLVLPFWRRHGPGITFQHDNVWPHIARLVRDSLQRNNVNVIPWPARSPDLSPIEHTWYEMDRRLRRQPRVPQTLQELRNMLQQIWTDIPQDFVRRLVHSMRRRCVACIATRGGHTRYGCVN